MVDVSADKGVVDQSENDDAPEHDARPVHRDERDGHGGREEGKEGRDDEEAGRDDVDGEAELAHGPGAHADVLALDALADHQEDGEEIGQEKAGNGEGDDGVEGRRGADVDQADDGGDAGAEEDGPEGEGRFADLFRKRLLDRGGKLTCLVRGQHT